METFGVGEYGLLSRVANIVTLDMKSRILLPLCGTAGDGVRIDASGINAWRQPRYQTAYPFGLLHSLFAMASSTILNNVGSTENTVKRASVGI